MSSCHSRDDDVAVDDAGQRVGEIGQLVVVRGEQRLRPRRRVRREVLGDRPGDAQAVEGRRAAADLVEDDEAARRRACAGCCAVSCISTMNVDWPRAMLSEAPTRAKMRSTIGSFACARRHERAGLRHQRRAAPSAAGRSTCRPCSGR